MNAANPDTMVVVVIPTFRRPDELSHLLDALALQEGAPPFQLLIGDNDAMGGAGLAVAKYYSTNGYPIKIDAFVVLERGLSSVRNTLFQRALTNPLLTHIALIDDDEWPDPGWLAALMFQQRATRADAVGGPVRSYFPAGRPRWASEVFVFRPEEKGAGLTPIIYGTNNAVMTRELLEQTPRPWFDSAFNLTGGEDLDFFMRLRRQRRSFAWAPDAWVTEWVPEERARIWWVLRRVWRIGNTDTLVGWRQGSGWQRVMLIPRTVAFFILASVALPLTFYPGRHRVDHLGRWVRSLGRIAGLFGKPLNEYGR